MAMTVMNNSGAMSALGQLKKNDTTLSKQLKKVASGMKVNGAGDGASEYSISERMRVRLRALEQDDQNVQNGAKLLRVAEGGIQNQLDIIRTIKAKVIDANNDTNTDADRATIQKEINQGYDQINDIAAETTYNGRLLLLGGKLREIEMTWSKLPKTQVQPESNAGFIPDESWEYTEEGNAAHRYHPKLDGIEGPFDIFHEYEEKEAKINSLGLDKYNPFSGGTDGTASEYKMTLAGYGTTSVDTNGDGIPDTVKDNVSKLNNVGFCIDDDWYVLTTNPSQSFRDPDYQKNGHREYAQTIDISGLSTYGEIASAIATAVNNTSGAAVTAKADGTNIIYTTKDVGVNSSRHNIAGVAVLPNTKTVLEGYVAPVAATKGYTIPGVPGLEIDDSGVLENDPMHLHDGYNASGQRKEDVPANDPDYRITQPYRPGTKAHLEVEVAQAPDDSGVTLHSPGGSDILYLKFISGDSGLTKKGRYYTIGKSANIRTDIADGDLELSMQNGILTLTAKEEGSYYNGYYLTEGVHVAEIPEKVVPPTSGSPGNPGVEKTYSYGGVTDFDSVPAKSYDNGISIQKHGKDGDHATLKINYPPAGTDVEDFIKDLRSKSMTYFHGQFGFIDSKGGIYAQQMSATGTTIDLDNLRQMVKAGKSLNDAFAALMMDADKGTYTKYGAWNAKKGDYDSEEQRTITADATGVTITYPTPGTVGNSEQLAVRQGSLRHYDIDFDKWIKNGGSADPEYLNGKGFRAYCATDPKEWWNFWFVNGEVDGIRPKSGTGEDEINSIVINVEKVADAESLVQAIYQQAEPYLEGKVEGYEDYNHYMRFLPAGNGVLTMYDWRHWSVNNEHYLYQQEGAKIADGIFDNVQLKKRKVLCEELVIQHTDKANMNIKLLIPRTTMDQVFGFLPEDESAYDYTVADAEMRTRLLGDRKHRGILDKAVDYLTDANTIIGSQINHMEFADKNIVTQKESTQSSESVIRDSDMAKEMTNYTKANILAQSAQAMLAQANQNAGSVISLLQ